jgi:ABC-type transporter Mla MlaB component
MAAPRLLTLPLPPSSLNASRPGEWFESISPPLHRLREALSRSPPETTTHTQTGTLAAEIDYDVRNAVLHIQVFGPLNLRCALRMRSIAAAVDETLIAAHIRLAGVTRVFDSGIAALMVLVKALADRGIGWVCIDGPEPDREAIFGNHRARDRPASNGLAAATGGPRGRAH